MWITSAILLLLAIPCSGFWNIPNLFRNYHITLFTIYGNLSGMAHVDYFRAPYFNDLLRSNPSSPIVLTQLRINPKTVDILNPGHSCTGLHSSYSKMTSWVTFLHIVSKQYVRANYRLRAAIFKSCNPSFLFQHCDEVTSSSNYDTYYTHRVTGGLVLFNFRIPNKVFIPCLLCDPSQIPNELIMDEAGFSISEISKVWVGINNNMQQNGVVIAGTTCS